MNIGDGLMKSYCSSLLTLTQAKKTMMATALLNTTWRTVSKLRVHLAREYEKTNIVFRNSVGIGIETNESSFLKTDSKFADSQITDSQITDSQITDSKITDSQITDSQITDLPIAEKFEVGEGVRVA